VCYRESPKECAELAELQAEKLDPVMEYVKERYGIELKTCKGISSPQISDESFDNLEAHCRSISSWNLAALESAASCAKSTALALALVDSSSGYTLPQIIEYARLEELYNQRLYGYVEGAHDIDEFAAKMILGAAKNVAGFAVFN
jgi:ATP synthase F1 complex assembly factor 2